MSDEIMNEFLDWAKAYWEHPSLSDTPMGREYLAAIEHLRPESKG